MELDAGRIAAGESEFVRLATPHEFCPCIGWCITGPTMVFVTSIAPGVRLRWPIQTEEAAA
jgi:hypothetical protein